MRKHTTARLWQCKFLEGASVKKGLWPLPRKLADSWGMRSLEYMLLELMTEVLVRVISMFLV